MRAHWRRWRPAVAALALAAALIALAQPHALASDVFGNRPSWSAAAAASGR